MSPHPDRLPPELLDGVAREIGLRIPLVLHHRPPEPGASARITESFRVFRLTAARIRDSSTTDLRELAAETGRFHHQVEVDGKPVVFARSTPGPGPTAIEVAASPLATEFDRAIRWIDENVRDDVLVRILEAPAYHLLAFWLLPPEGATSVVVVDKARRLESKSPRRMTAAESLRILRAAQPVMGVRVPPS
jgi:hypothetical protein